MTIVSHCYMHEMTRQKDNGLAQDRNFSKTLATLIFQGVHLFLILEMTGDKIAEKFMTLKA